MTSRAREEANGAPVAPRHPAWFYGWAAWMLALAAFSFALPDLHFLFWTALGVSSVAAMLVGIRRNRPRRAGPWLLLAGAVACLVTGDVTAEALARFFDQPDPFPSVAEIPYLLMYVLIAAGMVWLYRLGVVRRDAAGVLDALTLTAGVALITWVYLIGPYVENPDLTLPQKVISIAYPLGDMLVLAAGGSLVASTRATTSLRLLAAGGIGLLVSDVAYGIIQINGNWRVGTPVDLGWVAFYTCWGLAALHPSMRELTEPKVIRHPRDRLLRLVLLGLASFIAPTILAIEVISGDVHDGLAIAVLSAVLSILVLTRLGRALRVQRRSFRRERALRRAGAALLSATDASEVSRVVTEAVGYLLPRRRPSGMVLDLYESASGPARSETGPPSLPGQNGRDARRRREGVEPSPDMVYTATLPPEIASQLRGFEVTLRCDLPAERGRAGTLYLAADETVLVPLQESASVLAGQAGQTLQRIALSSEINRRDSEAYFRTLVLNTADVILILDLADRIRYASPSAAQLFEASDLTGAALPHLVEPDSQSEVMRRLTRVRDGEPDRRGLEWHVRRPGRVKLWWRRPAGTCGESPQWTVSWSPCAM